MNIVVVGGGGGGGDTFNYDFNDVILYLLASCVTILLYINLKNMRHCINCIVLRCVGCLLATFFYRAACNADAVL